MGYSLGQWVAPWMAGRMFDAYHNYNLAWQVLATAAALGAAAIYALSVAKPKHARLTDNNVEAECV
jgi:cyanate permease